MKILRDTETLAEHNQFLLKPVSSTKNLFMYFHEFLYWSRADSRSWDTIPAAAECKGKYPRNIINIPVFYGTLPVHLVPGAK